MKINQEGEVMRSTIARSKRILWLPVLTGAFLLLPRCASAQSATVTDDAFLSTSSTAQLVNLNGQGISLLVAGSNATVGSASVGLTKSYIKFQLSSSLPPGTTAANVTKATLKLFISPSYNPTGAIDIYPITSAWTESTLNPSSPPTYDSTPINSSPVPVAKADTFMVIDLTELVQDWLEASSISGSFQNNGIALVADTSATYVVFDSKESIVTSHEPRLEIVLVNSGAAGPTGPAGAQGPAGASGGTGLTGAQGVPGVPGIPGPMGTTGSAGATGPQGATGSQGPQGGPGPQGSQGPAGAQGPQGPIGFTGARGPIGPAGPPLSSFEMLAGLPCTRNAQQGNVVLTYSANGDAALNCVMSNPPPPPPPPLSSLTPLIASVQAGGQVVLTLSTTNPVPSDFTVTVSLDNPTVGASVPSTVVIPAAQSSASFTFATQGTSAGGTVAVTASANGVMLQSHIQIIPTSPPNFSCLGAQPSAADDPIVISGTVGDFQFPGFGTAGGVLIEVHKRSDDSLVTSTTTDNIGNFSLSVPTAGVPFDSYLALSKAGYVSAREYWSKPLTRSTSSVLFLLNTSILNVIHTTTIGQLRQPNTGTLVVSFADCGGAPFAVAGTDVMVEPVGGWSINARDFELPGNTWVLNQPVGATNVSAASGSTALGAAQFNVVSGQMTIVSVSP